MEFIGCIRAVSNRFSQLRECSEIQLLKQPRSLIYELPHEAEKSYRSFVGIKKKQNGKMAVTFLKLNIFWFCFFLTISTYCETLKNEVYLPKTNFWGSLPPIQNKKYFCGNLKNTKFSKIISDRFLYISGLPYSFSGFGITSVSWNVQK